MTHAEIMTRATAEAERRGFALVAIYARPEVGEAITLCLTSRGGDPWAVYRFSTARDRLSEGAYYYSREEARAEFKERLDEFFDVWHLRRPEIA